MTELTEQDMVEHDVAPEIPRDGWQTLIFLQRHGRYDNRVPADFANPTEEEKAKLGRLTAEGRKEAHQRAKVRIESVLASDPEHTYILLVNSPTYWLDNSELGQRAQETAQIIGEEIQKALKLKWLTPDHLLNTVEKTTQKGNVIGAFKEGLSRPELRIGESPMFQFPEYIAYMREKYKGQDSDFWQARNADVDQEMRKKFGTPGPEDDAEEIELAVGIETQFARKFHSLNPGNRLLVWNVTHGDSLEPYAQRKLGIPEYDFRALYNEGIAISIDDQGEATVHTALYDFPVDLPNREELRKKLAHRRAT